MSKLKERLFGLIVVIALGIIFVPMLLENTQNPKSNVMQNIPAVSVAKSDIDKNQKPDVLAKLQETPSEKLVVYNDKQPIADHPDAKTPGYDEDLKRQEKREAIAEQKADQEKVAQQQHERAKLELELEQGKREHEQLAETGGWVVQMGSFAEHSNAGHLLKKLKAAGYPAFTRHVSRYGMQLTVVMVGPHARREDADRLCSTLAMKFQIEGIVVRYEPAKSLIKERK